MSETIRYRHTETGSIVETTGDVSLPGTWERVDETGTAQAAAPVKKTTRTTKKTATTEGEETE